MNERIRALIKKAEMASEPSPEPPSPPETSVSTSAAGRVIIISSDVRFSQQDGEVVLERRTIVAKGKHAGEERWLFVGAYGSLEMAAASLIGRHYGLIQPEHVTSLKELITEIRAASVAIVEAVRSRGS